MSGRMQPVPPPIGMEKPPPPPAPPEKKSAVELTLPEGVHVEKASVLTIRPGDVIALAIPHAISPEMADRIQEMWYRAVGLDDVRVILMTEGLDIVAVIRKEVAP